VTREIANDNPVRKELAMTSPSGWNRLTVAARRRRPILLSVGVGVLAAGAFLIARAPSRYRAEAVVKVLDARPPADYIQPSFATPPVSEIVAERMKALRLHVLNRPILAQVAEEVGFTQGAGRASDRVLEDLRDRFEFRVEGADTFTVGFEDTDPSRAERVVNRVTALFMEQENKELEGRADSTVVLLRESADSLRKGLDAADLKIADFKRQHYGALPEQQEENLRNLDHAQMEIDVLEQTVETSRDRRRRLLENAASPLRKAEDELSSRLESARAQYTDQHGEVRRLQDEYAHVRAARIADERQLRQKLLTEDPEVRAVDAEIERTHAQMATQRKRQTILRGRTDATAKNQQALAGLTVDRDVLKDKYSSVQAKLREAETSARMAERFRPFRMAVLEPAAQPARAAGPNRPLYGVAVLLIAAGLAFGTALALEQLDRSVREPKDVELAAAGIAVLAAIPRHRRA
jgi:uncharacterized protein involved in exopolysaccharide biosynthesis